MPRYRHADEPPRGGLMAREHAQIKLAIWSDDDFRDLTRDEQLLYFTLVTHPSLSYCGVVDWRPARIAALASDWTREDVETTAKGLIAKRYIVVDDETEEALVRSFIRNDEILKQPKVALAMLTAWAGVASKLLRGVIVHEIKRLHAESPTLPAFTSTATASGERLRDLLAKPGIDPTPNPSGNPSVNPSGTPSRKGSANPSGNPSGSPDPSPDPVPKIKTHAPTERGAAQPSGETQGQRVNRLTRVYTDRIKLSKFEAVQGIVRKAVQAADDSGQPLYSDAELVDALNRLADERRGVTVESLRVALEGFAPSQHTLPGGRPSVTEQRVSQIGDALAQVKARRSQNSPQGTLAIGGPAA
jgi:hypothetical protein